MRCPYCRHADSRVVDSREADEGQVIRRRRSCPECGRRFTTVEEAVLAVVKRSGVTEPFSRQKVIVGVRKACQGRPVDEDALALLAQRVEEAIRATGAAEVPSHEVGLAILGPLRELDEVAYLRFASVYRAFDSLERLREGDRRAARRAPNGRTRRTGTDRTASHGDRPSTTSSADEPRTERPGTYRHGESSQRTPATDATRTRPRGSRGWRAEHAGAVGSDRATGRAGCASSGCTPPRACTPTTR